MSDALYDAFGDPVAGDPFSALLSEDEAEVFTSEPEEAAPVEADPPAAQLSDEVEAEEDPAEADPPAALLSDDAAAPPAPRVPPLPSELRRRRVPRWLGVLAGLALLAGLVGGGGWLLWGRVAALWTTVAEPSPDAPTPSPDIAPELIPPSIEEPTAVITPANPPEPTPAPMLATTLVAVSGPGSYPARWPYQAEYRVTLTRGDPATVTLTCDACLWQTLPQSVVLTQAAPVLIFEALVLPGDTASFQVAVWGQPCVEWELRPANAEADFSGSCVPMP